MAHECPECGMTCHCNGDIESHDCGDVQAQIACICCGDEDFDFSETAEQAFGELDKIQ